MFSFAWPWIFLLLPLPWLIHKFLPPRSRQQNALRVPFFSTLTQLLQAAPYSSPTNRWIYSSLWALWILVLTAAARPQWMGDPIELPRAGRDIMLAVDLSGSMQIADMTLDGKPANRLAVVKRVLQPFIAARKGDRLGLILFGSQAYLQTPLTFDLSTVQTMLEDASINLAGPQTALGDAIALAVKRFIKRPNKNRVLILLTDGANNAGRLTPQQGTELAVKNAVKIYTIGLGADSTLIDTPFGKQEVNPSQAIDEITLKNIAAATGGLYFRAKDTAGLKKIYQKLEELEPSKHDSAIFRPIQALYVWPLAAAFLFSILWILLLTFQQARTEKNV